MAKSTVLAKVNAKSPRRKDRSLILTVKLTLYWAWIWRLYKRTKQCPYHYYVEKECGFSRHQAAMEMRWKKYDLLLLSLGYFAIDPHCFCVEDDI